MMKLRPLSLLLLSSSLILNALWAALPEKSGWSYSTEIELRSSVGSLPRGVGLLDTADRFGVNWWALRADPRSVHAWWEMEDFLSGDFELLWRSSSLETWIGAAGSLGVRRDFEAWWSDPAASNLPLGSNQFDINVPYRGYFEGGVGPLEWRVGRFEERSGPSPERGVTLSGSPYFDALKATLDFSSNCSERRGGCSRYTFFYASLNPWLEGTPEWVVNGDGEREQRYPEGSEMWVQQKSTPVSNQRSRLYSDLSKNFAYHRIDFVWSHFRLGVQENALIGGKSANLGDLSPLAFWHNRYGDGFTNSFTTLDLAVRLPYVGQLYGEYVVDDINEDGATQPTVGAALFGWHRLWALGAGELGVRFEGILVDPLYGRFALPLLELTDRRVWRSNNRDRLSPLYADTGFVDTWVVDAPLGYWRGPDVVDLWLDLEWKSGAWGVRSKVGWLSTGAWNLRPEYDWQNAPSSPASGDPRRELWLQGDLLKELLEPQLALQIGFRYLHTIERGDLPLATSDDWGIAGTLSWRWKKSSRERSSRSSE